MTEREQYLKLFLDEALEVLESFHGALLKLDAAPGDLMAVGEAFRAAPAAWLSCVVAFALLVMGTRTRGARGQGPSPPRAPETPLEPAFCSNMKYARVHRVAGGIKFAGRGI